MLEGVGKPESFGFQSDQAHTYLYLMGYNAPEHALLQDGYSEEEFYAAYENMTEKLRPWTIDFHVAQNDGTVHGAGSHDKTGKHCRADDPNGKLDITRTAGYWLQDAASRGIRIATSTYLVKGVFCLTQKGTPLLINTPQPSELTRQHASNQIPY